MKITFPIKNQTNSTVIVGQKYSVEYQIEDGGKLIKATGIIRGLTINGKQLQMDIKGVNTDIPTTSISKLVEA